MKWLDQAIDKLKAEAVQAEQHAKQARLKADSVAMLREPGAFERAVREWLEASPENKAKAGEWARVYGAGTPTFETTKENDK